MRTPPRLRVESRAAGDDAGAPVGDGDPVTVAPDPGIAVEIGGPVAGAVRVAPESDRHRRHRLGDDQLALLADHRAAVARRRPRPRQPRQRQAISPARTGSSGTAADERGAHVGAAADRREHHVVGDRVVDPLETLGRQRRAGRPDAAQGAQVGIVAPARSPALRQAIRNGALVAEVGDRRSSAPAATGHQVGVARVAVEEHDRRRRRAAPRRGSSTSSSRWS